MTDDKQTTTDGVIRRFLDEFLRDRHWQINQTVLGAEICVRTSDGWQPLYVPGDLLYNGPAGQEWLLMARAAAGELRDDEGFLRGEVYETCQKWAEWLFAVPGLGTSYHIPDQWYESPAGAIWAAALVWSQGDELITIAEAAALAGVPVSTISSRIDRGQMRAFVNPDASRRQARRLVRRGDALRYKESREAGDD